MNELLQKIICTALNNTFKNQPSLSKFVPQETREREPNLSFHFANELWKFLFWLDCDFDITKSAHDDKRPDLIFHKRGIGALNFLVVEVKRKQNPHGFEPDVLKIKEHWFGAGLHYQFGASVVIDEDTGDYELRLYERANSDFFLIRKADFKSPISIADIIQNARKVVSQKAESVAHAEQNNQDTTSAIAELNDWVCKAYRRPWNIDDIIIGATAAGWLNAKRLLPSSWGLDQEQLERIRAANIRLTIMFSPASLLTLDRNPLNGLNTAQIIIVDANVFENPMLTTEENIATMLHEVGHVFYKLSPKPADSAAALTNPASYISPVDAEENAADDYAHKVGYGKHIASGLKKLTEIMPQKFKNEKIETRIRRMEEATRLKEFSA